MIEHLEEKNLSEIEKIELSLITLTSSSQIPNEKSNDNKPLVPYNDYFINGIHYKLFILLAPYVWEISSIVS